MSSAVHAGLEAMAAFVAAAEPPDGARLRARVAITDTIGVALAGVGEPAATAVRGILPDVADAPCAVWGSVTGASAPDAALANGTAAHALDYDDMCFVSLAHPSAPLVPALLAAGELAGSAGRDVLDAYVVGFEVEARLGRVMNPRHYQRGWHCTSTLGAIGSAAAVSRLLGLDAHGAAHALAIAASSASGLKENFGTMVKPLHAGLAARDGVLAGLLAKRGMTASGGALEGAQGFLHAMDGERRDLAVETADLGRRWEMLDTGITVKLYPSCAGTHPTLDALIDLRAIHGFTAEDVARVEIEVDPVVPTILLYDRPTTGLEAKFSMPYCAAAAIVHGRVGPETFDPTALDDPRSAALMARVTVRVDEAIGLGAPALTRARVRVHLRDGRALSAEARGARGYPDHPASEAQLDAKFLACATRALPPTRAEEALEILKRLDSLRDIRSVTAMLRPAEPAAPARGHASRS